MLLMQTKIAAIRALKDNYIWAIHGENRTVTVVDPGQAQPVIAYLTENQYTLDTILLTHHHADHTGGVQDLLKQYPNVAVYGSLIDRVPGITHFVQENDTIALTTLPFTFTVLNLPGHTLGHIGFYGNDLLFCGDTLFSAGCGRLFEGTYAQLYHSLEKLRQLPLHTHIYCAHEYTLSNLRFAQAVEPNNLAITRHSETVLEYLRQNQPSLPSSVQLEQTINPFWRCQESTVMTAVQEHSGLSLHDPLSIFTHLRKWKDQF